MSRIFLCLSLLAATALCLSPTALSQETMGRQLAERLDKNGPDDPAPVIVVMKERPDITALEAAGAGKTKADRRRAVLDLLKARAVASQAGIRTLIEETSPEHLASQMKYLWINNTLAGWLMPATIDAIAERDDIESIRLNVARQAFIGARNAFRSPLPGPGTTGGDRGLVWSLPWIRVDTAWSTYNVDGNGVTVAMVDTGADYRHPDLNGNIWVNPGEDLDSNGVVWDLNDINGIDDDGNGYVDDLVGFDFGSVDYNPMDDDGHGTHTAGSVGGDGTDGTQTGVAPGCNLMICKVGYYVNYTDEASMWEGWQYAADNNADVISMSMGWLQEWLPHRITWRQTAQTIEAAGVTMVIAAGNERAYYWITAPNNIRTPADCPEVITVGATGYKTNNYASFSSYGPSEWNTSPFFDYPYPPGLTKPDIAAPGEKVNSTTWGGGYSGDTWSGTSMATPHVAGVVALMLEANPSLTPGDVKQIIEDEAIDLGPTGKDNDYGAGLIDTPDAVYGAINHGPGSPSPDIKINGQNGPLTVTPTALTKITISLDQGSELGVAHDWWLFGDWTGYGQFWWKYPNKWKPSSTPIRAYNGPLVPLTDFVITDGYMPIGYWTFTFAVDQLNNSYEGTYIDTIDVQSW